MQKHFLKTSAGRTIGTKKPAHLHRFSLAEKEGFEPSNGFTRYTISSRAPSTKLGDFSISDKLNLTQK